MSCDDPPENVAVAVNCCVAPKGIFKFVGVISKDAITTNVVDPEMLPEEAVIVTLSFDEPEAVAKPVLLTETEESDELHVEELVISFVVLSE